ncbi:carbohydrate porin [soil metagenome]
MSVFRPLPPCLAIALLSAAGGFSAQADTPDQRSGFYFGGHVGYMFGSANAKLADPIGGTAAGGISPYGTSFAGLQAGYQVFLPSKVMLGVEADFSFADTEDFSQTLSYRATGSGTATENIEYLASLRGRLGYDIGGWTPFVTGGIAWASTRFSRVDLTTGNEDAHPSNIRLGYVLGAGVDYRLSPSWSARAEYLYTRLGPSGFSFASAPARYDSQNEINRVRFGLNYHFGQPDEAEKDEADRGPGSWEIHGVSAAVFQGYPPFKAPYTGANSLPAVGQSRATSTLSAFLGVRLWSGGELYYNPELLQGYGLALTTGAGGFPNGDAQRNFAYPQYSTSRLFVRQAFGLGGERETVESDFGQLAGERDISRITVQAGRFAVQDIFDNNTYANDPRVDFLNFALWSSGAYDYPANSVGFSWGVTAEFNQPNWTGRLGYFLEPTVTDNDAYDLHLLTRGGYIGELELRYKPFDRPGAVRLGAWLNRAKAGSYNAALALAAPNLGVSANDTIAYTRQSRTKYGLYINLEQQLSDDVGAFFRFNWNDGQTEIMSFTDIDLSIGGGLSINGASWKRPKDTIGIGGAVNQLSGSHARWLAAGGLGITVGDGALTYTSEIVTEAYYSLHVSKGIFLTADYQFLANPAYNAVRGPAHVFAGRFLARF